MNAATTYLHFESCWFKYKFIIEYASFVSHSVVEAALVQNKDSKCLKNSSVCAIDAFDEVGFLSAPT
jgi:hypothetical protein